MKFIEIAVRYQQNSATIEEAIKMFKRSCDICCYRGLHLDCSHCQVEAVHKMTVSILSEKIINCN